MAQSSNLGMKRSFLTANVEDLVKKLKVDEKIALLGAPNWWNTSSVPRLEIPSIRMSDGPNVWVHISMPVWCLMKSAGCSWFIAFCANSSAMLACTCQTLIIQRACFLTVYT